MTTTEDCGVEICGREMVTLCSQRCKLPHNNNNNNNNKNDDFYGAVTWRKAITRALNMWLPSS